MNDQTKMHGFPCLSIISQLAFLHPGQVTLFPGTRLRPALYKPTPSPAESRLDRSLFSRPFSTGAFATQAQDVNTKSKPLRIGIIGGGIAGVTVAHSLAQRLASTANANTEIIVLEGDVQDAVPDHPPTWMAATARNANSLVPGAAMHVFSRQNVLWSVLQDTAVEWYREQRDRVQGLFQSNDKVTQALVPIDNKLFDTAPPYFALHLLRCIGPSADSAERTSFVRFCSQFLYTTMWLGDQAADERGRVMCQLAKANRVAYCKAVEGNTQLQADMGHSKGFLSLHRSLTKAQHAVEESKEHGEEAVLLDWQEAVQAEPRLNHLPMKDKIFAVSRPNDYTASCETFVRTWIKESTNMGVEYLSAKVDRLEARPTDSTDKAGKKFRVTTVDDSVHEFDILVLTGGVRTPLMAAQLGAGPYCPTYPLRGFSLTLFAPTHDAKKKKKDVHTSNLVQRAFSIDSMYCTSVSPRMARLAGFGEFVGYREKAASVPSYGPTVLSRYARAVFPDAWNARLEEALPCFRPLSPDDIPLVGEVESVPGLFIHTGHGTLGWTTGLVTGDCTAQAITDRVQGRSSQDGVCVYTLADGTTIDRKTLSPSRFVSRIKY